MSWSLIQLFVWSGAFVQARLPLPALLMRLVAYVSLGLLSWHLLGWAY